VGGEEVAQSGKSGLPWMRVNEWMMMEMGWDGMGMMEVSWES